LTNGMKNKSVFKYRFKFLNFTCDFKTKLTLMMLKKFFLSVLLIHTFLWAQSTSQLFNQRKVTALVYSTFIPGAGQFYLGHKVKGVFFTLATFGSLVTTIVSQNNLVGGNERLENLELQYLNTMNWERADQLWQEMLQVKADIDKDYKRRNLFLGVTVGIWVANIIDVLFFTSDKGSGDIFGSIPEVRVSGAREGFMITAKFNF
jgi:TM2 domain-containing membrane protein YozV